MSTPTQQLHFLLGGKSFPVDEIGWLLDGMSVAERLAAVRGLGFFSQRKLYDAAEGRPVSIDDMVPPGIPVHTEVIHEGKNTLPVHQLFQKRFARQPDSATELCGYNEQTLRTITGPGYYVARQNPETGELDVDYTALPNSKPAHWPEIRSQTEGLSRFIYGFMVDKMRKVSQHVTIGRAWRHGKPQPAYFVLCRQD